MKISNWIYAVVLMFPAVASAEYKNDWNYKNFYEAVNTCRSAIVYPAATDYEKKGLEHGQTKELLRNEVIATMPVFESVASDACYCALNEYAKDLKNSEFIRNWQSVAPYMETPRCKGKMGEAIKVLQDKEKSKSLMLK